MGIAISARALGKHYRNIIAVDNLSIDIRQGEIYGFLGLNGAGKTTTIRMLLGMIHPTTGSVNIFGEKVDPGSVNIWSRVGYLVDVPSFYPDLTVRQNLEITRRLYGNKDPDVVDTIMDTLGLSAFAGRRAGSLSRGNMQRLGLAKAFINGPDLVILDEPSNGLDPAGIVEVREMLLKLAHEKGVTIFMSSHILDEVARLADRIAIIHKGKLLKETARVEFEQQLGPRLAVSVRNLDSAKSLLLENGYRVHSAGQDILEIEDDRAVQHPDDIAELLVRSGLPPTLLAVKQENLEEYFFRIIGNGGKDI